MQNFQIHKIEIPDRLVSCLRYRSSSNNGSMYLKGEGVGSIVNSSRFLLVDRKWIRRRFVKSSTRVNQTKSEEDYVVLSVRNLIIFLGRMDSLLRKIYPFFWANANSKSGSTTSILHQRLHSILPPPLTCGVLHKVPQLVFVCYQLTLELSESFQSAQCRRSGANGNKVFNFL